MVRVPEGYKGAVLQKVEGKETRSSEPQTAGFVDLEQLPSEAGEEGPRTENLETKAEFEQMVVWGHESTADPSSDPYVRMEEWLTIANQVSLATVSRGSLWSIAIFFLGHLVELTFAPDTLVSRTRRREMNLASFLSTFTIHR